MDVIYTDRNGIEKGVLLNYYLDLDCGVDNDFEISVNIVNNVFEHSDRFYIEDTEYGGVIDNVKADTQNSIIYYSGRSWRGILSTKIIRPLSGQDYYLVSGEANNVIQQMIDYVSLNELFIADETISEFNISNFQFNRYVSLLDGLNNMLQTVNAKLLIRYIEGMVELSAVPIIDYSDEIEYSQDSNINFIAEDNQGGVNHLICLGSGDLAQRQVIDLYVDDKGSISTTQHYFGLDEVVATYDYSSVESLEELKKGGEERLKELMSNQKIEINVENMDLDLYDVIAGKEEVTGIYVKKPVNQKIVRIENGLSKIEYKVGD